ncbi:MAG: flagellar hook-associated protein FlgK [Planctomycetes bacterium]|nr:flagellar hook-associated protein FlgK [Planctomycetota bacterium]
MANIGLNIGLRALLTSQASLDVIGQNLANANTPGYSRQRVQLGSSGVVLRNGLGFGTGVDATNIGRSVDNLLAGRIVNEVSDLFRLDARVAGLSEAEAALGEPGGFGISTRISDFFMSASELSASAGDSILRTSFLESARSVAEGFRSTLSSLDGLRGDSARQAELTTTEINVLTERVANLNQEIRSQEASGLAANGLRDDRDQVLRELSKLVDISYTEASDGAVNVQTSGRLLVGLGGAVEMSTQLNNDGSVDVLLGGSAEALSPTGGKLAGILSVQGGYLPKLFGQLDSFARDMILEANRIHSTGIPEAGHMTRAVAEHALQDADGDGQLTDELLADAGLPFDLSSGTLRVNVRDLGSGVLRSTELNIDAESTTVADLLGALSGVDGVGASLDAQGRLEIQAESGFGFDFSARLNDTPDADGTFGSGHASLGTAASGPFTLAHGDTLDLIGPAGAFSVTLDQADFFEVSQATAGELADVLNANSDMQANGLRAVVVAERLFIQSEGSGASESFEVTGGSALASLGWTAGATISGSDAGASVSVSGAYTGEGNDQFVFTPRGDGDVGTTPGLLVDVHDAAGNLVATLDVGEDYLPGSSLEVADGVSVSFGFGSLSATENDAFSVDLVADSDTSDVLVALGIGGLFTGSGAEDIGVSAELLADPSMLNASTSGMAGDAGAMLELLGLQHSGAESAGGKGLEAAFSDIVTELGFEAQSAMSARDVEEYVVSSLDQRRAELSGVNVDEELVEMMRFEQSFAAASRYISVINDLNDSLLALI